MVEIGGKDGIEQKPLRDMVSKLLSTRTYHDGIKQLNQLQNGARKPPAASPVLTP
jgi:hypothetical protein